MSVMTSQITGISIVCSAVCPAADKKNIKTPRHWPLGNSPVTGKFPAKRASNAVNVSIGWRHHWCRKTDGILLKYHSINWENKPSWSDICQLLFYFRDLSHIFIVDSHLKVFPALSQHSLPDHPVIPGQIPIDLDKQARHCHQRFMRVSWRRHRGRQPGQGATEVTWSNQEKCPAK